MIKFRWWARWHKWKWGCFKDPHIKIKIAKIKKIRFFTHEEGDDVRILVGTIPISYYPEIPHKGEEITLTFSDGDAHEFEVEDRSFGWWGNMDIMLKEINMGGEFEGKAWDNK